MPTETKFRIPSGASFIDLSGVFEPLNGGTSYGTATKFKVGSLDLTGVFHASSGTEDRITDNTGYKLSNGSDLKTVFRKYGYAGITITSQPTNQVVNNNSTATFSLTATAAGTPTYQWYGPSGLISGATSSSYTTGSLTTANDSDSYYCTVSYGGSSVNSNSVSSKIKPYVTSQPSSISIDDGTTTAYAFQITAAGSGTLYFQWFKNGSALFSPARVGNISSSQDQHVMNPPGVSDVGNYYCKVTSNYDGTGVNSSTVSLSIIAPIVTLGIDGYSAPFNFNYGNYITLISSLSQGQNVTYQWHGPSGVISGATGSTYLFQLNENNDGNYYVVATNGGGSSTSSTITVHLLPEAVTGLSDATVSVGDNAVFSFVVYATDTLYYNWYKNGSLVVSGSSSNTFVDINMSSYDNGNNYYCIAYVVISGTTHYSNQSDIGTLTVV